MKNNLIYAAIAFAIAAILFIIIGFHKTVSVESVSLQPLHILLVEHEQTIQQLKNEKQAVENMGLLSSYLSLVRRDGVPAHLDMKQKLDALDKNIISTLALVDAYVPYAKTDEFKSQAAKYREYALAWHDRWTSVMELFMAGGIYSAAEPAYPDGFSAAVASEIKALH